MNKTLIIIAGIPFPIGWRMEYQLSLLVFYSWLGMGNGIPAIIISVLFMDGSRGGISGIR
jgi:hypothetical protein